MFPHTISQFHSELVFFHFDFAFSICTFACLCICVCMCVLICAFVRFKKDVCAFLCVICLFVRFQFDRVLFVRCCVCAFSICASVRFVCDRACLCIFNLCVFNKWASVFVRFYLFVCAFVHLYIFAFLWELYSAIRIGTGMYCSIYVR